VTEPRVERADDVEGAVDEIGLVDINETIEQDDPAVPHHVGVVLATGGSPRRRR
jgi:hypothetical protein